MATVKDVLGAHAYTLARYGVSPDDDLKTAYKRLADKAPHLARFIKEVAGAFL
ncbi:hypothetical protein [Pyrobaculum aerophilum]|uniref:hypothetical protein n=1 Tax=Pyrobaculum aerophilum TaxID=13773 RepID=UPI0015F29ADD|nr:hypothetical protein [Pyrobaculum aerophilum]